MSLGSRKVNTEDIDEELLIASIGRRTQDGNARPAQEPPAVPAEESTGGTEPPAAKEKTSRESSRRKRQEEEYMKVLRRNELRTRQCVYIGGEATWTPYCGNSWNSTRNRSTNCTRNKEKI